MKTRTPLGLVGIFAILLCWPDPTAALEAERAEAFLQGLLDHPDSLEAFVDPDDLAISGRLGIRYPEAPCKPLISWDLSPEAQARLRSSGLEGQFAIEELDDEYSRLILFPTDSTATRSWVFRDGQQVSSILYQVRGWKQIESPHFRFFVSDSTMFHPANIDALEQFLSDTAAKLGMPEADLDLLKREKIIYCFCSNQDEIRELTGFFARGMFILSHDIIVSTYSAHFHELAHLLINFKLKQPHLYTHPFFLEGFAVAVGGRGGKSQDILHQLGLSNLREGWVTIDELLDTQSFYQVNASMSYPASGVYNRFLLEELETAEYLRLYSQYAGDVETIMTTRIEGGALPADETWLQYLENQPTEGGIRPGAPGLEAAQGPILFQSLAEGQFFGFAVPETTLVFAGPPTGGYRSFLYEDFFQDQPYDGQRYFIRASSGEAAVYDLFTNTMIALYASGFSTDMAEIPSESGLYLFRVARSVLSRPPIKE